MNDLAGVTRDLSETLEAERAALLEGDLAGLATIASRKARLIETLRALAPGDRALLAPFRDRAMRNQRLLDHALAGLRDVSRRMGRVREAKARLDTYDDRGRRQPLQRAATPRLDSRA